MYFSSRSQNLNRFPSGSSFMCANNFWSTHKFVLIFWPFLLFHFMLFAIESKFENILSNRTSTLPLTDVILNCSLKNQISKYFFSLRVSLFSISIFWINDFFQVPNFQMRLSIQTILSIIIVTLSSGINSSKCRDGVHNVITVDSYGNG